MRYPPSVCIPLLVTNCWDAPGMIVKCGDIRHHSPLPACAAHPAYHIKYSPRRHKHGWIQDNCFWEEEHPGGCYESCCLQFLASLKPFMFKYFPVTLEREEQEGWVIFTWVLWSLITHLPTHSYRHRVGGAKKSRDTNLKSNEATEASWHCVCSCVRQESELCHPRHSLILIEIYACLAATDLTGARLCSAMSVTRCDTVTHGSDHTHDVGSVSANQRPVLRLLTNERPV